MQNIYIHRLAFASVTLASFLLPATLYAADSCNALLTVGIYNVSQSSSANEGEAMAKSVFCSADYSLSSTTSTRQASVKAAFSFFSGGASGSTTDSEIIQTQKNICTSGFNSSSYSNEASSYSRTIYQGALDAWNQCNTLASQGLNFEVQASNTMQGVTVSLSTASKGTVSKFLGISQIGVGTSVCKTTNPKGQLITLSENTLLPLNSASKITIICKRNMQDDGSGNLSAEDQTLIFNTSAGAYQVALPRIGLLASFTVDQATAEIRTAVDADIQKYSSDVNDLKTRTTNIEALTTQNKTLQEYYSLLPSGFKIPANWDGIWLNNGFSCPVGFKAENQHYQCELSGCIDNATWLVCVKN